MSSKFFKKYQLWLKSVSEIFWSSAFLLFWNNIIFCFWLSVLLLFQNNNVFCSWSVASLLFWNNNIFCSWHAIFKKEITKWVSRIRLDMHSHFASFHIKLKLIITEYKMLLKYFILIRCIILLYFFLVFLIFFSD